MKTIEEATLLYPEQIAEKALPDSWRDQKRSDWIKYLVTRAEFQFQHTPHFRKSLLRRDWDCRDTLLMWMEHWVGKADEKAEISRQWWMQSHSIPARWSCLAHESINHK
jgi:hypothetical protein